MRLQPSLTTAIATAGLALSALAPACAGAATTPSALAIHEHFTPLACPSKPRTTVQIEGCAERRVLTLDKRIDSLNLRVFAKLGKPGRTAFTAATAAWVSYRNQDCTAQSSIYSGGSIQPVAYANCLVSIDGSHVAELKTMLIALAPAG